MVSILFVFMVACTAKEEAIKYETKESHGEMVYYIDNITVPESLGYPQLTDEELSELTVDDLKERGLNYIDLIHYVKLNKDYLTPGEISRKYIEVLAKYYDEAGLINVRTNKSGYDYIYVKTNDTYYPLDLYDQAKNNIGWFERYSGEKFTYNTLGDVLDNLKENFYFMDKGDSVQELSSKKINPINVYYVEENGVNYKVQNLLDIEVYYLNDIQIPVGLGFPEYSNEEIDQMIVNPDKSEVADKIHTVGDAINYVIRAGFTFDDYHNEDYGDFILVDVGNRYYKDGELMTYSLSGLEILQLETGQCSGMCTLFNYLLWGDYPEVGYCNIPRHAFMYLKGKDNKYYLFDPVKYTLDESFYKTWFNEDRFTKISSDTIDGLMGNIMEAGWLDTYYVIHWTYDGTFSFWSGNFDFPEEFLRYPVIFPEGSEGAVYGQNMEVEYKTPKHDTTHQYMLGIKIDK